MTTFSRIVDELALQEFNRPHMRSVIASYLNQTIRDVHFKKGNNALVHFPENRREAEFLITDLPALWPIPNPPDFQVVETIYNKTLGRYLVQRTPANAFELNTDPNERFYWYRTGASIALNGVSIDQTVLISYFEFPRQLVYFVDNQGPAVWDPLNQVFVPDDPIAIAQVSNWLLQRHSEALKEGVRAKLYRRLDNEIQSRLSWSEFQDVRAMVHFSEGV